MSRVDIHRKSLVLEIHQVQGEISPDQHPVVPSLPRLRCSGRPNQICALDAQQSADGVCRQLRGDGERERAGNKFGIGRYGGGGIYTQTEMFL